MVRPCGLEGSRNQSRASSPGMSKRPPFAWPMKATFAFCRKSLSLRQIDTVAAVPSGEVTVDLGDLLTIEYCGRHRTVVHVCEANQRYAHRGTVVDPRLIAPRLENPKGVGGGAESPAACSATDGIRGDEPRA